MDASTQTNTHEGPTRLKRFSLSWSSLDAYILSEIHAPFMMAMIVYNGLFFIYTLGNVTELSEGKFEVPLDLVFMYFLAMMPEALFYTTSLSFLFASLAAVSRMSGDSEIVAPQSLGISFWRMSRPVIIYGLILSSMMFVLINSVGPRLTQTWMTRYQHFVETAALPTITPGIITPLGKNSVLYVDRIEDGRLADLFTINQSSQTEEILLARRASIYDNRSVELYETFGINIRLTPTDDASKEKVQMFKTGALQRNILIPSDFAKGSLNSSPKDLLTTQRIYQRITTGDRQDDPILWTEFWRRMFTPLICLVFSLFAIPMAAKHSRLSRGSGFGLSLLVVAVYLAMDKLGRDAATQEEIAPYLGTGAAAGLFLTLGIILQIGKNRGWNRRIERIWDVLGAGWVRFRSLLLRPFHQRKARSSKDTLDSTLIIKPTYTFVFPSKLDTYLIRAFVSIYLLVQASLLIMLILLEYTQISKAVQRNNIEADVVLRYLMYRIPDILHLSMFICLLISVLILFAMLAKNHELTVIRAGGGSLRRLCFPLLICALMASGLSVYVENQFLPQSNRLALSLKNQIKGKRTALFSRDVWLKRPGGEILNYQFYDDKNQTLRGVRMYRLWDGDADRVSRVELPELQYNGAWTAGKGGAELVFDYKEFTFTPAAVDEGQHFELNLTPDDFSQKKRKASEFSIGELRDYLDYLEGLGYAETHYLTALYAKYASPFVPFIMMLLAMSMGFQFGRRGTFYGVGAGLLAGLIFYGLFELFKVLGSSGMIAPLAAGWTVVTVFGFIALYRFINME